jgi:hypothetical protein
MINKDQKRDALIIGVPTKFHWYRIRVEFNKGHEHLDGDQIVFAADDKSALLAAINKAIPNGAPDEMHKQAVVVWASELEEINGPVIA